MQEKKKALEDRWYFVACVVVNSHVIYSVCTSSCTDGVFFSWRLKKKKEQNLKARQLAEETGNTGRMEITEREEREAENNVKKLQDVSLKCRFLICMLVLQKLK